MERVGTRIFRRALGTLLVLSLAILAAAPSRQLGSFPAIPIGTDRDLVNFLVSIHRAMPEVLTSRLAFNREIQELFAAQRRVRAEVSAHPQYGALEPMRPHPFRLTVQARPGGDEVVGRALDPRMLAHWRSILVRCAAFVTHYSARPSTLTSFEKQLEVEWTRTPSSINATLVQLTLLLKRYRVEFPDADDVDGFTEQLNRLTEADLEFVQEPEYVEATLQKEIPNDAPNSARRRDEIRKAQEVWFKELQGQYVQVQTVSRFEGEVRIEATGSDIGVFRGFFGDDCSTAVSFSYPYSPLEWTFFLFDQDGKRLGYAAGSQVLFNGRPAFYLHTINGPWIRSDQVSEVINALYRERGLLGAEALVLPVPNRAHANINFAPIFSVFRDKFVESQSRMGSIEYRDSAIRSILHRASVGDYDLEQNNRMGAEYIPTKNPDATSSITVQTSPSDVITPYAEGESASLAEVMLLVQGLYFGGRAQTAHWVLSTYGITGNDWNEFRNLISAKLRGSSSADALREALVGWGMTEDRASAALTQYSGYFNQLPPDLFPAPIVRPAPPVLATPAREIAPTPVAAAASTLLADVTPGDPKSEARMLGEFMSARYSTRWVARDWLTDYPIKSRPVFDRLFAAALEGNQHHIDGTIDVRGLLDVTPLPGDPALLARVSERLKKTPRTAKDDRAYFEGLKGRLKTAISRECNAGLKEKTLWQKIWGS